MIAAEYHELCRRCEGFIKCTAVDKQDNRTQQTEIIVQSMKEFEERSHLLIAISLSDMFDDVVRVLNPTFEQRN